jgi:hypothetical protein
MLFSHPLAEQAHSDAPAHRMGHENLFHAPDFAPGTALPDFDELVPASRQYNARPRRTTGRRTAA